MPRVPEGVMAHPSRPQFSSSQAVIRAYRWPRPSGATPTRMRTGKHCSATEIIPRGLPGISTFLVRSKQEAILELTYPNQALYKLRQGDNRCLDPFSTK